MDYISDDKSKQLEHVRSAIVAHVDTYPDALIVIEEYDKLDCPTRSMLRQLIEHSEITNVSFKR